VSTLSAAATRPGNANARAGSRLPRWWPLAAITLLAAALRLSTIDLQSFWYDEAFTPVHVLHASLISTLRSVVHTENTPPLWYVLEWADARVLGDGPVALRLPSALAGIAIVPVAWGIGRELAGRRAAVVCASIVAVNPLFVWYSQEARAYSLFALAAAVAMLCFLRARRSGTPRAMTAFAISGAVALLTHYFALFLLIPMVALLVLPPPIGPNDRAHRRAALPAVAALAAVGAALIPLISAQGGHGTQWIGRWPIGERLQAIPQYFLTGYSGAPLGHGVELLVALPLLAAVGLGLWRMLEAGGGDEDAGRSRPAAVVALVIAAGGVLTPVVLVAFGADYLAPRNLLGAMIPVAALIAVLAVAPRPGALSTALVATMLAAFLVVSLDVDLSPRLQRGNWRDVAAALRAASPRRALTTVELGAAPLEYYLGGLHNLHRGTSVRVDEIDETGYAPLRASAGSPPAPGFRLFAHLDVDGLVVYRFRSSSPRKVSESTLRRHVITLAHPEVLVDPRFTR
jgi:mannosyltransferase